jgi:hypothetical protein
MSNNRIVHALFGAQSTYIDPAGVQTNPGFEPLMGATFGDPLLVNAVE